MEHLTRLGFVKTSAKAAAGAAVAGGLISNSAQADPGPAGSEPVVAYVKDPRSGEITLMSGEHETVIRDRQLAAKISRALA